MTNIFRIVKEHSCPYCHAAINTVEVLHEHSRLPVEGDITVCNSCASILMFNARMDIYLPSIDEISDIESSQLKEIYKIKNQIEYKLYHG